MSGRADDPVRCRRPEPRRLDYGPAELGNPRSELSPARRRVLADTGPAEPAALLHGVRVRSRLVSAPADHPVPFPAAEPSWLDDLPATFGDLGSEELERIFGRAAFNRRHVSI